MPTSYFNTFYDNFIFRLLYCNMITWELNILKKFYSLFLSKFTIIQYVKKDKDPVVVVTSENKSAVANGIDEELINVTKTKVIISPSFYCLLIIQLEEMQQKLDLQIEIAASRLSEIQEIVERNKTLSAELEGCKIKVCGRLIFTTLITYITVFLA